MSETEMNPHVTELLNLSRTLNYYEKVLDRHDGEKFNLFNILGIGNYEVRTHSPILAELLNPQGTHGQDSKFLKLFIEQFSIPPLSYDKAHVKTEVSIGNTTDTGGGRLDILVEESSQCRVIIENKIYAGEQENQLGRYANDFPNAKIVYLTLYRDRPKDIKDGKEIPNLICISYKDDILKWLEKCLKETASAPIVRESIVQYINLIKQLTNQDINNHMSQEITKKVIADKDTLEAYFSISESNREIGKAVVTRMNEGLETVALKHDLSYNKPDNGNMTSNNGFSFSREMFNMFNFNIGFQFDKDNYLEFTHGFKHNKGKTVTAQDQEAIFKLFKEEYGTGCKTNPNWIAWRYWNKFNGMRAFSKEVLFGSFFTDIENELVKTLKVAERFIEKKKLNQDTLPSDTPVTHPVA